MTTIGTLTQVFVGNVANDGTGDTLRQAFVTTNNNMSNLSGALGDPIGSTVISNSSGFSFSNGVDTVINSFNSTAYRTAKYIASVSSDNGYQASEILIVQDGLNANLQVTGESANSAPFVTFTSNLDIPNGNVLIWANSTESNNIVKFQTIYITV